MNVLQLSEWWHETWARLDPACGLTQLKNAFLYHLTQAHVPFSDDERNVVAHTDLKGNKHAFEAINHDEQPFQLSASKFVVTRDAVWVCIPCNAHVTLVYAPSLNVKHRALVGQALVQAILDTEVMPESELDDIRALFEP